MNINKALLALMILNIFLFIGIKNHAEEFKKCHWRNISVPEALIVIHSESLIGIMSGDLIYKGRYIRQLLFGQTNGYGSRWWAFEGVDGKSFGGGRLLLFRGPYPLRGTKWKRPYNNNRRRVLLVGLGSSIYYSDLRKERDLITASEGFWQLEKGCYFP